MASDPGSVQFVCEQARGAGDITYRKMFGEYALYADNKVVALICEDRLFLKPTDAARALLTRPVEAPPYPGAKPYLVVDEHIDDAEFLSRLVRVTAQALPEPGPKKRGRSGK